KRSDDVVRQFGRAGIACTLWRAIASLRDSEPRAHFIVGVGNILDLFAAIDRDCRRQFIAENLPLSITNDDERIRIGCFELAAHGIQRPLASGVTLAPCL